MGVSHLQGLLLSCALAIIGWPKRCTRALSRRGAPRLPRESVVDLRLGPQPSPVEACSGLGARWLAPKRSSTRHPHGHDTPRRGDPHLCGAVSEGPSKIRFFGVDKWRALPTTKRPRARDFVIDGRPRPRAATSLWDVRLFCPPKKPDAALPKKIAFVYAALLAYANQPRLHTPCPPPFLCWSVGAPSRGACR